GRLVSLRMGEPLSRGRTVGTVRCSAQPRVSLGNSASNVLARAAGTHDAHRSGRQLGAALGEVARILRDCLSRQQWNAYPKLQPKAVIPHGVEISQFTFREKPGDYACYLGRFTSGKGPLQAIEAARTLGLRLVMAGAE